MKKSILLCMLTYALAGYTISAHAQEKPASTVSVMLNEADGKVQVSPYIVPDAPMAPAAPVPEIAGSDVSVPPVPEVPLPADSHPAPPAPVTAAIPEVVADRVTPLIPQAAPDAPAWLEELRVYPNPLADGALHLRFRSAIPGPVMLKLVDLQGSVVYAETMPDAGITIDKIIKVPAEQKGIFVLQLEQGGRTYTERILVR